LNEMTGGAGKHNTKEQRKVGDVISRVDSSSFTVGALEGARDQYRSTRD